MSLTIALVGNPNCGKTTLFNALTGARQRVGNWPGVTVERKTGRFTLLEPCTHQKHEFELVDLPGLYSLTSSRVTAIDQKIACDYILSDEADLWINLIDAAHLERHLYLSLQLLEMGLPLMIVVNMMDVAHKNQCQIDLNQLSQRLKCPVIGMSAHKQLGRDVFEAQLLTLAQSTPPTTPLQSHLPKPLLQACERLQPELSAHASEYAVHAHWLALRLLESDTTIAQYLPECCLEQAKVIQAELENQLDEDSDIILADARYRFAHQLSEHCTERFGDSRPTTSARLDKLLLNRLFGLPCFLLVMYGMFLFSVNLGHAFQDFFDLSSQAIFVDGFAALLHQWHAPSWMIAILAAGAGKGINTTLTFIPIIGSMFLCLSFLEASGYMARAAFVIDKVLAKIGLPGKSFVPLIVGFGCNVPAIMGARTLNNPRDRILTVMMTPFMSCSARLAIYAVFSAAFFTHGSASIVFALYLTGIFMAILTGLILHKTLLRGESSPMIMELPPYHMPTARSLMMQTWHRLKGFVIRAGKLIIPLCILIGALNAINMNGQLHHDNPSQPTILSKLGQTLTPAFAPIGVKADNWPATVGLLTGVLAKETVIATLNTLYTEVGHLHQGPQAHYKLSQALQIAWQTIPENLTALSRSLINPIAAASDVESVDKGVFGEMYKRFDGQIGAFAYLLFVLLYFPCISTMATIAREINKRWMLFSMTWTTAIAYTCATLFYQCARLTLHPASSVAWILGLSSLLLATLLTMRHYSAEHE